MNLKLKLVISLLLFMVFNSSVADTTGLNTKNPKFEIASINHKPAAFFYGTSKRAAVFVPGSVFDRESWYFLAERLQQSEIASLSLDGKGKPHVLAAIKFLAGKGFEEITLVGGSIGGGSVLNSVHGNNDPAISKIILLAPYGGNAVKNERIDKLFIVSQKDSLGLYSSVQKQYDESSQPKTLEVLNGSKHAQHLFKGHQKEALTELIIEFIRAAPLSKRTKD